MRMMYLMIMVFSSGCATHLTTGLNMCGCSDEEVYVCVAQLDPSKWCPNLQPVGLSMALLPTTSAACGQKRFAMATKGMDTIGCQKEGIMSRLLRGGGTQAIAYFLMIAQVVEEDLKATF